MAFISVIIASGFGTGFLPKAPGTWGTALAAIIATVALLFVSGKHTTIIALLALVICTVGYASIFALPKSWSHDDPRIVIDEIAGLFVALLFVPLNFLTIVMAFILFRIFDIAKPFGIKKIDRSDARWSIMVDDILAGVYANIVLRTFLILL